MASATPSRSHSLAQPRLGWLGIALVCGLAALGCGREIGDECRTSVDCSFNGDRFCDIAQPGGYCTVDGCDETSCPDEAVCVRFYPVEFLSKPCAYTAPTAMQTSLADGCDANEICLPTRVCAPRSTERRYCALKCSGKDDCRGGYECRVIGQHGSVALTPSHQDRKRFCAPRTTP